MTYSTPLNGLDVVVIDTETTGLDAATARVVQIGAVRITHGKLDDDAPYSTLVDPGITIPVATSAVHGITDRDVAGKPRFAGVAGPLADYVGTRIVVGHTIRYDMTVLAGEYAAAGLARPAWRTLDIRPLARIAAPNLADHSLDRVCEWLGIRIEGRHTALGDAQATAKAFLALLPLLRAKNIRTFAEAEAAVRRLAEQEAVGGTQPFATDVTAAAAPLQRLDSFAYRTLLRDVMSAPPLYADENATIGTVMRQLVQKGVSSVFVRLASGETRIATERDILRAIDTGGAAALAAPIGPISKGPLQTAREDEFVYRAIGRVSRLNIRHLGVTDASGELVGAVTTRNLLRHRATTAIMLGDEIDMAPTAGALAAAWAKLPVMARSLVADDVDPLTISAVVSAEISAMTRRSAELAVETMQREGHGAPPQPFAVLVLGSAGRGESQLAADQDNAIVYAEGPEGGAVDKWFEACATRMSDILDEAGIPLCKGGVMAKNRAWRKDVVAWGETIDGWVRRQRPEDLLSVDIFFDSIPVYGHRAFGEELWHRAYTVARRARDFQNLLIESARSPASPFTLFGGFKADASGRLDLKRTGLMPLFTAARVLSIRHGIEARSSAERMRGVAAKGVASQEAVDAIIDAQRTLLGAVIGQQLADIEAGIPPSTRVLVQRLSAAERERLKDALKTVANAVDLASEGRV